jgi:hypothetical protein
MSREILGRPVILELDCAWDAVSRSEKIVERARANGLIVPLVGYRVYVIGASPAGLSPQTWNALRTFWTLYFREAGAELVSYSAECSVERE